MLAGGVLSRAIMEVLRHSGISVTGVSPGVQLPPI
jgi:hypothetical protein